ncbi:hypothetical protein NQ314_004046 [Rhamnusium bicolor]|uniref:Uncharacterized protein n=1 Tax=Rhamnusium bicolor TaxID=1586634 RepID=A0AAV8ZMD1_9CUCU|nr:hypothetical protein NQ314_004046 [Rhamnusium bicolor]
MNSTTGKSPYELLFGYAPRGVANAILDNEISIESTRDENLVATREKVKHVVAKKQGKRRAEFDRHRYSGKKYQIGDQILVRTTATSNQGKS